MVHARPFTYSPRFAAGDHRCCQSPGSGQRRSKAGANDITYAASLGKLAEQYFDKGHEAEGRPLLERALAIYEKLRQENGPIEMAFEPFYKRALAMREKALGPDHPEVARTLRQLAEFSYVHDRKAENEALRKRALSIAEKAFGPDHPDTCIYLRDLAELYEIQDVTPRPRRS